ncbi:hypothetical protein Tco_0687265 [Tanacetum coccineum]
MALLPHRDLRHLWLRYLVDGYDEGITLRDRLSMVYIMDDGEALFTSHAWKRLFELGRARRRMTWRQFILALGLHSEEEMEADKVIRVDIFYIRTMDCGTANVPYLLAQYLFHHAEGRMSRARLSGGHFIGRLTAHFGLVSDQGLRGLMVVVSELLIIDLHELGRLNIYARFGDTWAWVAPGPERQQDAVAVTHGGDKGALIVDEGA